mgnify:CR=1 FL=1
MGSNKRKRAVLEEFTKILHDRNPMGLPLKDMPDDGVDEYESEALSILSRFNEGALQLCEDGSLQREIAVALVKQCFVFWFNEPNVKDIEKLSFELLDAYKASYPMPEQGTTPEVPSES